jgi:N-methylhydantoinase B
MADQRTPRLDPITVKILWDRLVSIANEATTTQQRAAFSTVVREANDFACSIMDIDGGTLAQSDVGLPSFVATQAITLRALLKRFPLDSLRPGDVLITTDPWITTGQVMDLTLLAPVFRNGQVIAFGGSVAHSPDLGQVQRWTLALDVFEEGIFIPPMHLIQAGEPNETLYALIRANCRTPGHTLGDLDAQLSALRIIEQRILELLDEQHLEDLEALRAEIYSRSEEAIRAVIEQIPDGVYEGEILVDSTFPDPLAKGVVDQSRPPLFIRTKVTIAGSDMTVDYTGSSPQVAASINSIWTFTLAYTAYAVRLMTVSYVPNNAGFMRPLTVISPEGTILNARYPAPCLNRHVIGHQVGDAVYGALAQVVPERIMAQGGSTPVWVFIGLGRDRRGHPYNRILPVNGGLGALPHKDGETATFPANLSNTPVEVLNDAMQAIVETKEIIPDSAGPGKYRGGFGQRLTIRAFDHVVYTLLASRIQNAPQGLLGGHAGRAGHIYLNGQEIGPGDGQLQPGDVLVFETPGGGGLYSPLERSVAAVVSDVQEGLISPEAALEAYGVVLDAQSLLADLEATIQLRARRRKPGQPQPVPAPGLPTR